MKSRSIQAKILMMSLTLSILSGCSLGVDPRTPQTVPVGTQATGGSTAPGKTTSDGKTKPATKPVTMPLTKPAATQVPDPVTQPATKPVTKPATKPATKPDTTGSGSYSGISNSREEWSYGYPTGWVRDYGGYWKVGSGKLYLTMDLGYEMGYTDQILKTLNEKGVKVTFFVTTEYIRNNPGKVRKMLSNGHKVGNHSTGHINMVELVGEDGSGLIANTRKWETAYKDATGRSSHLYRAPEGVFSRRGMAVLEKLGYKNIFWGAAYADWDDKNQPSIETAKAKLYPHISDGDIVLLHPFKTNAELLPELIDDMRARGYGFGLIP